MAFNLSAPIVEGTAPAGPTQTLKESPNPASCYTRKERIFQSQTETTAKNNAFYKCGCMWLSSAAISQTSKREVLGTCYCWAEQRCCTNKTFLDDRPRYPQSCGAQKGVLKQGNPYSFGSNFFLLCPTYSNPPPFYGRIGRSVGSPQKIQHVYSLSYMGNRIMDGFDFWESRVSGKYIRRL